jgi:hypothetical protein
MKVIFRGPWVWSVPLATRPSSALRSPLVSTRRDCGSSWGSPGTPSKTYHLQYYKNVTRVLRKCYRGVARVLGSSWESPGKTSNLPSGGCYRSVTRVLRECYVEVGVVVGEVFFHYLVSFSLRPPHYNTKTHTCTRVMTQMPALLPSWSLWPSTFFHFLVHFSLLSPQSPALCPCVSMFVSMLVI